jgi:NAD(P)-dependent dehydrogenase (short-subunit alcohol dehydrogenase family)
VGRMLESGEPGIVVTTSSGDGGLAPVPYASVCAASKAAVSCFTEALAHQLADVGANVTAAVFYPSGGLFDTGRWSAPRNRPAELARTVERASFQTFEQFTQMLEERAGAPVEVVDLDELGRFVVQGVKTGRSAIGHDMDEVEEMLVTRAHELGAGKLPTPHFA